MKIAVMGYGTIVSGVVEVLEINKEKIAKRADIFMVAPASANVLGKMANLSLIHI